MNLRVFYLTRWGLSDGYGKQITFAEVFIYEKGRSAVVSERPSLRL